MIVPKHVVVFSERVPPVRQSNSSQGDFFIWHLTPACSVSPSSLTLKLEKNCGVAVESLHDLKTRLKIYRMPVIKNWLQMQKILVKKYVMVFI